MTRDQIIEKLFTGQDFRDAIGKMEPAHLRQDLASEVMLEVCEWSDDKVIDLHTRGKLGFYVAKVMLFMLINKYSPFYKKFRVGMVEWTGDRAEDVDGDGLQLRKEFNPASGIPVQIDDIQKREVRELQEDEALAEIANLYWYDQELVNLYIKHGNYRAIEAETGIAWESAYRSIQKSLKHIRCQVLKLSSMAS